MLSSSEAAEANEDILTASISEHGRILYNTMLVLALRLNVQYYISILCGKAAIVNQNRPTDFLSLSPLWLQMIGDLTSKQ